jgi:alpha-ketoglutarate-dependent taurine dioxygenase
MIVNSFEASVAVDKGVMSDLTMSIFQHVLEAQGYLHLEQLPDSFDHLTLARKFGTVIPHQHNGEQVFSIKVDPKLGERYPAFTTSEVEPHTEGYEYEHLPLRYQCLWCIQPPTCGGGQTLLCDGYAFMNLLSEEELDYLMTHRCEFMTPSGSRVKHLIYDRESGEMPIVRFNFSALKQNDDPRLQNLANRLLQFFDAQNVPIHWSKNDFLIWDNYRMLHSRTHYRDRQRELKRVYLKAR